MELARAGYEWLISVRLRNPLLSMDLQPRLAEVRTPRGVLARHADPERRFASPANFWPLAGLFATLIWGRFKKTASASPPMDQANGESCNVCSGRLFSTLITPEDLVWRSRKT